MSYNRSFGEIGPECSECEYANKCERGKVVNELGYLPDNLKTEREIKWEEEDKKRSAEFEAKKEERAKEIDEKFKKANVTYSKTDNCEKCGVITSAMMNSCVNCGYINNINKRKLEL